MNAQSRTRAISPLSMDSEQSNFLGTYQSFGGDPYSAAASRNAVPLHSPPAGEHNSASTDNSSSSRPSNHSPSTTASHVSSSSSVAHSNDGSGYFPQPAIEAVKTGRPRYEDSLQEHYGVLRTYLAPYLQGGGSNHRSNKARDKLLRLSPTQFHELSTDVYDELLRREDFRTRPGEDIPHFLPPKNNFHPKRNSARQKLSTLPADRFRQLATDVFYELERRIPRLSRAGSQATAHSPSGSIASSYRASSRTGMNPTPPNGMRGPPMNGQRGSPTRRLNGSVSSQPYQTYAIQEHNVPPRLDSRSASGSTIGSYGRPVPQTFQSNTLVPNKSTMVEDDETDDDDDGTGLEKVVTGLSKRSDQQYTDTGRDRETIRAYEAQVADLQQTVAQLEDRLRMAESEVHSSRQRSQDHERERDNWASARSGMDTQLAESQNALDTLQAQLEKVNQDRGLSEADMHAHHQRALSSVQMEVEDLRRENETLRAQSFVPQITQDDNEWRQRHDELEQELLRQQKVTDEVRHNAEQFLQEMRLLSEQNDVAVENEEQLRTQLSSLEAENREWRDRYTKVKTQMRTLKATSMGLPLHQLPAKALSSKQELFSETGQVSDVDVTAFQISLEELLHSLQEASPESSMEKAKNVASTVRQMLLNIDGGDVSSLTTPQSVRSPELSNGNSQTPMNKALVSRDTNTLLSAVRTFVTSNGLAPLSLVHASATDLTASVIRLLKTVGIKPSSAAELQDEDMGAEEAYPGVAPLSMNKGNAPIIKQPVPPMQKQTNGAGWFAMLKSDPESEGDEDEFI